MKLNKNLPIFAIAFASLFSSGLAHAESAVSTFNKIDDTAMINGVVDLNDLTAPVTRPDADTVDIANDFIQKFESESGLGRNYLIHAVMNSVSQQKIQKPDFIQSAKGEKSNWHIIRRFQVKDKKSADQLLVMMSDPDNFLLYQKQSTNELCKDALNDALMDRGAHFEYVYQYKGKTLARLTISGNACQY